jgi:hypothetical protein
VGLAVTGTVVGHNVAYLWAAPHGHAPLSPPGLARELLLFDTDVAR